MLPHLRRRRAPALLHPADQQGPVRPPEPRHQAPDPPLAPQGAGATHPGGPVRAAGLPQRGAGYLRAGPDHGAVPLRAAAGSLRQGGGEDREPGQQAESQGGQRAESELADRGEGRARAEERGGGAGGDGGGRLDCGLVGGLVVVSVGLVVVLERDVKNCGCWVGAKEMAVCSRSQDV